MPIIIDKDLPARKVLQKKIFCNDEGASGNTRYTRFKIAILNLMPTKQDTEAQLLRNWKHTVTIRCSFASYGITSIS